MMDYDAVLRRGVRRSHVAAVFVEASEMVRSRSLRHGALVHATFYRNFKGVGSYASVRRKWKRAALVYTPSVL